MNTLVQDIRYAFRTLIASPGFTIAALLCLALGIGATTAIFSVVNAVVLRPLPYKDPGTLARLYTEFPKFGTHPLLKFWTSPPEFSDLQRDLQFTQALEAFSTGGANIAGGNEPVRITAAQVTGGLMPMLGVQPAMGRVLQPADDVQGARMTIVLSQGLWRRVFGGDPSIVGRDIRYNGTPCTVVGIMPESFNFPPGEPDPAEAWLPLQLGPPNPQRRGNHFLSLIARLKPGITIQRAREELTRYMQISGEKKVSGVHGFDLAFHTLVAYDLQEEVVGDVRRAVLMLMGAVGFVLLIACVNVANLLLARAEARQREIAIRKALGAGYGRLAGQFVTEGVLLALGGAALGLLLAYGGLRLLVAAGSTSIPRAQEIAIDGRVLIVTLVISILTGIAFGLAPIAQIVAGNLHDALKAAAGRTTASVAANRFRSLLVISELALALVLLIGTGLMVRAFWKLQEVNAGLRPEGLLTLRIALPTAVYQTPESLNGFWTRLDERLQSTPGVQAVTVMNGMPPSRPLNANDTMIEGFVPREGGPVQNIDYYQLVGKHFFETVGARLVEGRFFDDRDGVNSPPVLIVNQTLAQTYWPGESAIGHRMRPGGAPGWMTVIGVVGDIKNAGLDKPVGTELFIANAQVPPRFAANSAFVALRTAGDPYSLVPLARKVVQEIDPSLPISRVMSMDDVIASTRSRPRFLALLLTLFAGVALSLAAVGIYGVISYSVAQRTNEFGIRMALGAGAPDVLKLVIRQGMIIAAIGVVVGLAGALSLTRSLQSLLYGVSSFDIGTFVAMAALLAGVTLIACYIPARRATRVDPMVALRYE
ncbi:MAG: ABC transporter permease [Bryobacteraceae bacterium]